ncbi:MAG: ribonuclease P protein component [Sphingobacteriia bacterium]|nr:ribonuclease P protein component [Sphingobacteriia bacterium]
MKQFSFHKKEKLKSRKLTDKLFAEGRSFTVFPIKVFYTFSDEALDFPVKTGVGVSGRNFKKATDRNRIKRLLREAFRIQKEELIQIAKSNHKYVGVFLLYLDKTLPEFNVLKTTMHKALQKLSTKIGEIPSANN